MIRLVNNKIIDADGIDGMPGVTETGVMLTPLSARIVVSSGLPISPESRQDLLSCANTAPPSLDRAFPDKIDCGALRDEQRAFLDWAAWRTAMILNAAPGSGKTVMAIFDMVGRLIDNLIECVIIVGISSTVKKRGGWRDELSKWCPIDHEVVEWGATPQTNRPVFWLVSYDRLKGSIPPRAGWIFDEVHKVKNPSAGRSKKIMALKPVGASTIVMSGTLVTERSLDLFLPAWLAHPSIVGARNITHFKARYCLVNDDYRVTGSVRTDELSAAIRRHMFKIGDTLVLPKSYKFERETPQTQTQRSWSARLRQGTPPGVDPGAWSPARASQWMQQLATGFYMDGEHVTWVVKPDESPKIQQTINIIRSHPGESVIVWCRYSATITAVEAAIDREFPGRRHDLDEFRASGGVLVSTPRRCGTGLNGLQVANIAIWVEHEWSYEATLQAYKRIHRHGQLKSVTTYLLMGGVIDNKIRAAIVKKRNFTESMFS